MSRRLTSLELVGREVELDALLRSYRRAAGGEAGIVTIAGDAGIGKSRLVEAFAQAAIADGARALRGGCVELGGDRVVFAPVVEALRTLIDEIGIGGLVEAAGHSCRAIARLIPELPGPEPAAGAWSPDEGDLFEELFALVRRLSVARPLVVLVEDLHWADRSTRELIRFLARNLRTERILLVLSYRSDDLHRRHPLVPLLAELERLPLTERITLSPLTRDEVAVLAERILDATPEATTVESLLERSDGNPFYVEELLAHHDEGAVPTPVRTIVVARAAGLSDAAQGMLRIASLIGRRPTHALLAQLSELPSARLTAALREAVDAAFLRADPDDRYAFRHELVREALYDDLLPSERTELHGRLAALIAASANPNDAEAAFHWGLAHETERALAAMVRAADAALERLAAGEAMTLLLRALELWPGVPDAATITGVTRSALLERAAEAAAAAGDTREAIRLARTAANEIDATAEPDRWLALADRLAWYEWDDGDAVAAGRTLQDARAGAGAGSPRVRATLLASLAELQWSACDYDSMRALAAEAVALAAADDDVAVRCRATALHGASLAQLGDIDAGLAEIVRARSLAGERSSAIEAMLLTDMTQVLVLGGRHAEVIEVAQPTVMGGLRRGVFHRYEVLLLTNYIDALVATGEWESVAALLQEPAIPRRGWRASTWILGAQLEQLLLRGDNEAAQAAMREYRAQTPASSSLSDRVWLERGEMRLALAAGDAERACGAAWRAIERAPDARRDMVLGRWILPLAMTAHADWVEQARARGDGAATVRARDEGERLAGLVLGGGNHTAALMHPAFRALCAAEHARIRGRFEPDLWNATAIALDAVPEAAEAAYAWFRTGEACLLARDRARAIEPLQTAWKAARRLDARPLVHRIEDLARRARLTEAVAASVEGGAPHRDAAQEDDGAAQVTVASPARFGLSPRELEVLTLVAEGRSNGEIGKALFITPKTASVHVTHILNKLGVSSRIEAALFAAQSGLVAPASGEKPVPVPRPA